MSRPYTHMEIHCLQCETQTHLYVRINAIYSPCLPLSSSIFSSLSLSLSMGSLFMPNPFFFPTSLSYQWLVCIRFDGSTDRSTEARKWPNKSGRIFPPHASHFECFRDENAILALLTFTLHVLIRAQKKLQTKKEDPPTTSSGFLISAFSGMPSPSKHPPTLTCPHLTESELICNYW